MNLKQILILILALVVLLGGVFFIARSLNSREQLVAVEKKPVVEQNRSKENDSPVNLIVDFGSVESIKGKALVIKKPEGSLELILDDSVRISIDDNTGASSVGQVTDLRIGELIKVNYIPDTKKVVAISIIRLQAPVLENQTQQ